MVENIEHDFEDKSKELLLSIAYTMVEFRRFSEEEQDFFMLIANTIIKQRDYRLLQIIDEVKENFKDFTEEEQDFFMLMANTIIKQRDPNYDIYADETIEKDFDIKNLCLEVKTIKEMLEKLFTQKDNVEAKKNLSVADFAQKYNIGKTQQQALRDFKKLPYHQLVEGGKITYIVEEVEKWFKNNRI